MSIQIGISEYSSASFIKNESVFNQSISNMLYHYVTLSELVLIIRKF